MNIHRKFILAATVTFFCFATTSWAQTISAHLSAGSDSLSADVQVATPVQGSTLAVGVGGLYMKDDYSLFTLNAGLQQSLFDPALTLGLGFKGVAGEVEKEAWGRGLGKNDMDFDVSAIGFSALAKYDLSQTQVNLPVEVYATVTAAPDPMSFQDATEYLEYSSGVNVYLIENGALMAQYTHIDFDLEKSRVKTDKSEDLFFLGMRLTLDY